jgi:hypothetical protein
MRNRPYIDEVVRWFMAGFPGGVPRGCALESKDEANLEEYSRNKHKFQMRQPHLVSSRYQLHIQQLVHSIMSPKAAAGTEGQDVFVSIKASPARRAEDAKKSCRKLFSRRNQDRGQEAQSVSLISGLRKDRAPDSLKKVVLGKREASHDERHKPSLAPELDPGVEAEPEAIRKSNKSLRLKLHVSGDTGLNPSESLDAGDIAGAECLNDLHGMRTVDTHQRILLPTVEPVQRMLDQIVVAQQGRPASTLAIQGASQRQQLRRPSESQNYSRVAGRRASRHKVHDR